MKSRFTPFLPVSLPLIFVLLFGSVEAAEKIRIGIPPSALGVHISLPLAQKKGFLKEEGVDAEIIGIAGNVAMTALLTGEIDYFTGIAIAARAVISGLPFKVVAGYLDANSFTLVTRPEIESISDLQGKTVGVNTFGTTPDLIARMILKHSGLDPDKQVKFIVAGPVERRLALMRQGIMIATVVSIPIDLQAKKMGFHVLARAYELFSYPEGGLVTTVRKMTERPEEIKRVLRAGIKANRYIRANREGTIQILMEVAKLDREGATGTYEFLSKVINENGSLPEKGFRQVIDDSKKIAKIDREVLFSEVADLSLLKEAQKELGIQGR